ncbi:MAG: hypothetical protein WAV50_02910 [Minisyncoccia bacterium]
MSFFENFLHKKKSGESVVVIDIGAESVAGAYVRYENTESPAILYTRRLPIEVRPDEPRERAMLRALTVLGNDLIREGVPALARTTGSGSADTILVSIDAPWQETKVRKEHFESADPFIFTKALVDKKLAETSGEPGEKMIVDESIIGTILNGYETRNPYGNSVRRASVIVMTSFIEREVADNIISTLRGLYHTKEILPIAGSSLRYQAIHEAFPHEHDSIILDATGGALLAISLVRRGTFVSLDQIEIPSDKEVWAKAVASELTKIAERYPLPRTIFLLAREPEIDSFKGVLDTANFGPLWLSDNPPKIVSVLRSSLGVSIRQLSTNPPDIVLLLMALYFQNRHRTPAKEAS